MESWWWSVASCSWRWSLSQQGHRGSLLILKISSLYYINMNLAVFLFTPFRVFLVNLFFCHQVLNLLLILSPFFTGTFPFICRKFTDYFIYSPLSCLLTRQLLSLFKHISLLCSLSLCCHIFILACLSPLIFHINLHSQFNHLEMFYIL